MVGMKQFVPDCFRHMNLTEHFPKQFDSSDLD